MKRKLCVFLGILMAVCLLLNTALAESWTCPDCGTSNTGNFCTNCGAKKPDADASDTTITNVSFSPQSNGDILIKWDDSASASSYSVLYTTDDWNSYYYDSDSVAGRRVILEYLIPGVTYEIVISNGTSEATETYTVPCPLFSEFVAGDKYLALTKDTFSLADLERNPMSSFDVQVRYPKLKYSRDYTAKLVLKTPYGYCSAVTRWDSFTLENRYTYVYSSFYLKNNWLDYVEDNFGSIPTGEYTFELFMDGQLYSYASFSLTK